MILDCNFLNDLTAMMLVKVKVTRSKSQAAVAVVVAIALGGCRVQASGCSTIWSGPGPGRWERAPAP